jgi:F0F1-type ATP synthase alpha subunit
LEDILKVEKKVYQKLDSTYSFLVQDIQEKKDLTKDIEDNIKKLVAEVLKEN